MTEALRTARWVPATQAEGPHLRSALWVQGCDLACPGCCNPELFDPSGGQAHAVAPLVTQILRARADHGTEGLTLLGGEPLQQIDAVTRLCESVARHGLGVIVFTGYTLDDLTRLPEFARLWRAIDTLVDGRYDRRRREPGFDAGGRRFIGSRNQGLRHRTSRYADPACWTGPNHAEIRIAPDGTTSVHGFPSEVSALARRWREAGTVEPGGDQAASRSSIVATSGDASDMMRTPNG